MLNGGIWEEDPCRLSGHEALVTAVTFFFHFSQQKFFGGFLHSSPSVLPILDGFELGMKKLPELCLRQPKRLPSVTDFTWRHLFPSCSMSSSSLSARSRGLPPV